MILSALYMKFGMLANFRGLLFNWTLDLPPYPTPQTHMKLILRCQHAHYLEVDCFICKTELIIVDPFFPSSFLLHSFILPFIPFFPILEYEPRPYQTDTLWLSYISSHLIIFSLKLSLPKLLWLEWNCYATKIQIQLVFWLFFITSTS